MGTVAYPALSTAEQIFKDLIWDPGIKAGELALEGAVPFLALPVVSGLEEFVIKELSDWMFNNFILLIDLTAIKLVNAEHQAAFDKAAVDLKIIAYDKGIDSPEFKAAREDAKATLNKYVRISGN